MSLRTIERQFPKTFINTISANGAPLSRPSKGVTILLHYRDGKADPCCAEVMDTETEGDREHAEIGLWFEDKELADYDGVFQLPSDLVAWLKELGYGGDIIECPNPSSR